MDCFQKSKLSTEFYEIDKNFNPKIIPGKNSAILAINYFGKKTQFIEKYRNSKNRNFVLIEDATHNFLNKDFKPSNCDHYIFFSFRKHGHIDFGGWSNISKFKGKIFKDKKKITKRSKILKQRKKLLIEKQRYHLQDTYFVKEFEIIEENYSKYYIKENINKKLENEIYSYCWNDIAKIRRKNWLSLDRYLNNNYKKLFKKIEKKEIPIGYVILVKNRDKLRNYLRKKRIFTSVHWKLSIKANKKKFNFENMLSNHILTIPIDQRYGLKEMKYVANCLNESGIK